MPWMWSHFPCFALAFSVLTRVKAFTFTFTAPAQCQNLDITWTGGQPPFQLLIIPPGSFVRSFSIPSSAYQGNSGSFSTPLLIKQNQRLMLSMSDATGISAGGISDLLTVGPPQGASQCNTADPGGDFYFSLDGDLEQCKPYPFTLYGGAIQPITIVGFVPLGNSFVLNPPIGDSFSWTATLPAGTSVAFSMTDSQGRNGGTSPIKVVGLTSDSSCLSTTVITSSGGPSTLKGSTATPSATISTPRNTQTSGSDSNQDNNGASKGGSKVVIIVGAVGGFTIVGITAFLFFCFRRTRRTKPGYNSSRNVEFPYDPARPLSNSFVLPAGYTSSVLAPQASPHHNALVSPFLPPTPAQRSSTTIPLTSQFGGANVPPQFSNSNVPQQFYASDVPQQFGAPNAASQQFPLNAPQRLNAPNIPQQFGAPLVHQQFGGPNAPQQLGAAISMPHRHNAVSTPGHTHHRLGSGNTSDSHQFGGQHTNPQFGDAYDPARYGAPSSVSAASTYSPPAPQEERPTSRLSTYSSEYGADYTGDTRVRSESQAPTSSARRGHQPRVILHTDIEESMELPVELPPEYSDSRSPVPGLSA